MPDVPDDHLPPDLSDELLNQLIERPISEVLGVVSPTGPSGQKMDDGLWRFTVSLVAWRFSGEPVMNTELVVRKRITQREIDGLMSSFNAYHVVRLRLRVVERSVPQRSDALFVEVVGEHFADDELNRIAQQLQEPIILESNDFGRFTLNRRVNWFETDTRWNSISVTLSLAMDGCEDANQLIDVARALWVLEPVWTQRIGDYAVAKLLGTKNDFWSEEGEEKINAKEFKERMKLASVTVYPNGNLEFWFNDGDLFWGHSIMVTANLTDGPTGAGIHG